MAEDQAKDKVSLNQEAQKVSEANFEGVKTRLNEKRRGGRTNTILSRRIRSR